MKGQKVFTIKYQLFKWTEEKNLLIQLMNKLSAF
jgi:hypothetical protein